MSTRTNNLSARPNVEQLEDRVVMNGTASLTNGVLTISATNRGSTIRVGEQNGLFVIQGDPTGYRTWAVKEIVVNGLGDDVIDLWSVHSVPTVVNCGTGNNLVFGSQSYDVIYGGYASWDRLMGGRGQNFIHGGTGINFMDGDETQGGRTAYFTARGSTQNYVADYVAGPAGNLPTDVRQGSGSNTCYFDAALMAMAQAGVNFGQYIAYAGHNASGQGVYNVRMRKGNTWYTVPVTFDGRTNQADSQPNADGASWAILMQRAFYALYGNSGGDPATALWALGRGATDFQSLNGSFFGYINTWLGQGRAIVAGTKAVTGSNLVTTHAYQVVRVAYVNGAPAVLLRNPWGFNGAPPTNGVFNDEIWISWGQFLRDMDDLTVG